ncbi:MBL fold metallo-hydrolase [Yoonia sp. 208BN28-4]|uniref:MBL fold metallo-hydrolase n=1 Tax=Yoonia sp. 208BN28-4 TaxID=3126505 RepID=UPI0030B28A44
MSDPLFPQIPGAPQMVDHDVAALVAPNPSPMTFRGTNTYVIGQKEVAIIDPGPAMGLHLDAILKAVDGRRVTHILVTHSHLDHSPLAAALAHETQAPVLAFGDSHAGRSDTMSDLRDAGYVGGGEGMDWDFAPDTTLADGQVMDVAGKPLTAIHTPGHIGNHLCFAWGDVIFSGDHVMAWATSLVSPPDGDMSDFLNSCDRLAAHPARTYFPGHGDPVHDPAHRLQTLISHRKGREAQILNALRAAPATIAELTQTIYADVSPALFPAAARNVFAHLIDLHGRAIVDAVPALSDDAVFRLRTLT